MTVAPRRPTAKQGRRPERSTPWTRAFRDNASGARNDIFAIKKKRGHPRTLSQDAAWQAYVAAAVTLLVNAKVRKRAALANVADSLRKSGIKGITAKKVETWHREISTERYVDPTIIYLYRNMLDAANKKHPKSPRLAAEELLETLLIVKL
jgi:hypothetical protein